MSNKHRHNQPVRSGATGQQPDRPVSVPTPAPVAAQDDSTEIQSVAFVDPRESPKPEEPPPPPLPAWRSRVQATADELATPYKVVPGTWLSKRTRKTIMTARELQRLGFDPKRFVKMGLVAKV